MSNKDFHRIKAVSKLAFPEVTTPIRILQQEGGLTNNNYKVMVDKNLYIYRIPGPGTNQLINRFQEKICTEAASALGIDAPLVYFKADTGEKISQFIDNSITLQETLIKEPKYMEASARLLRKLHDYKIQIDVKFDVFEKIEDYEKLIRAVKPDCFWEDYLEMKQLIETLKAEIRNLKVETVLCHNDPLCENFIVNESRMYLVDWEYAGTNDPLWDVADVVIEANFSEAQEQQFYNFYFQNEITVLEKRRLIINKILLDFLWSLWGLQRFTHGIDLYDYATVRYQRAKANLKLL